ncbi:acylneuraminate cytidylyltransferase family protein [Cytobacillus dafuensis]|nr:acylneuraminate cytidylyltransferase family protein [Cytobacillus dafuensis]
MVSRKNIAIIPARGGSKRLPKKNIIDFFDKPMIAWTIEAAVQANIFDRIIVSTDNEEIASVSKAFGAEVPFLRNEFEDDYSPVSMATIAALKQSMNYFKEEYENVVQLMANCPLRNSNDIVSAYEFYITSGLDFQISCFKFGWMNPWWAVKLDDNLMPERIFNEAYHKRSQDLSDLYCPTGAIWIAKCNELLKENTFYGKNHSFYPLSWISAVDIDDMKDFEMAKAAYIIRSNQK